MHFRTNAFSTFVVIAVCGMMVVSAAPVSAAETPTLRDYAGTWVLKSQRKNFMVFHLKFTEGKLSGIIIKPEKFRLNGEDFTEISHELKQETILQASISEGHLRLVTGTGEDDDQFSMTLADNGRADLDKVDFEEIGTKKVVVNFPLGTLERAKESDDVAVATGWPERGPKNPSKEITDLQAGLKKMVVDDQAVRVKSPISWEEVQRVDEKHYPELVRIYEHYGWPRISVVGEDAAHNYWLLVQHSKEEFQAKVLPELKRAVDDGDASKVDYAYLYDRVMVRSGKPQRWGTQGGACENGKTSLDPVDDTAGLAQRRKELHLMPIDQYLAILSSMCAQEEGPPATKQSRQ
jgi:uncharacterized protein DUF6624